MGVGRPGEVVTWRSELQVGLHTRSHRMNPYPDGVDHPVVTLMMGMQALDTFSNSIRPARAG